MILLIGTLVSFIDHLKKTLKLDINLKRAEKKLSDAKGIYVAATAKEKLDRSLVKNISLSNELQSKMQEPHHHLSLSESV